MADRYLILDSKATRLLGSLEGTSRDGSGAHGDILERIGRMAKGEIVDEQGITKNLSKTGALIVAVKPNGGNECLTLLPDGKVEWGSLHPEHIAQKRAAKNVGK